MRDSIQVFHTNLLIRFERTLAWFELTKLCPYFITPGLYILITFSSSIAGFFTLHFYIIFKADSFQGKINVLYRT